MTRSILAVAMLAVLLSGCARTGLAPTSQTRSSAMTEMHARPPATTFGL